MTPDDAINPLTLCPHPTAEPWCDGCAALDRLGERDPDVPLLVRRFRLLVLRGAGEAQAFDPGAGRPHLAAIQARREARVLDDAGLVAGVLAEWSR